MTIKELQDYLSELVANGSITEDSVININSYEDTSPYDDGNWRLNTYELSKDEISIKDNTLNIAF
jgi:hypothetical protein